MDHFEFLSRNSSGRTEENHLISKDIRCTIEVRNGDLSEA
jgi:hypothetical protein